MLTVNVDQLHAELPKDGYGNQATVDPAYILAIQVDFTLNHRLRIIFHTVLAKPGQLGYIRKSCPDGSLGDRGHYDELCGLLTSRLGKRASSFPLF